MTDQRTALVTGATRGIGRAIATMLAEEGYGVTITARTPAAVADAAKEMTGDGYEVVGVAADVTRPEEVAGLLDAHTSRFGRLDVLINNAGVFVPGPLGATDCATFEGQLQANLTSAFLVARAATPLLCAAGAEHHRALLVNMCSILGHFGHHLMPAYSASKAGLLALTQALHGELAPTGVRVTALSPGMVATDVTSGLPTPPAEMIQPQDIAEAVRFLLRTSPACVVPEIKFLRSTDQLLPLS